MASRKLTAILELKDRLSAPLKKATSQLNGASESTNKLNESMKKVGSVGVKAIVGAGAVIGTAMAGVAAYSTKEFLNFEKGMNEVFTLLPGISDTAMSEMREQVKDFSKEFSALPEQVVPALYQSLSAGVPQDNVFEFLEVAQKAAVGGVTELATAVDGISSVVNAYGSDVIDATKTSDLMFTAVKLGKTNFEELSASLYNVIPTASALGVEFGDVTAGMAAMTAQGTPTSVATTQMRQLFVELSKDGGKASKMFQKMSGKTFKDFIAEGHNVQDALQLMEKAAEKNNVGINDLFGSVEAGNAALALTGKGTEAFSNALEEMANSAGATDTAFDTMQRGIGPVLDNIRARTKVAALDLADKFAPAIEDMANKFLDYMPQIESVVSKSFDVLGKAITFVTDTVFPNLVKAFNFLKDNMDIIKPILAGLGAVLLYALVPSLKASAIAGWAAIAPWLPFIGIAIGIMAIIGAVAYAWRNNMFNIRDHAQTVWNYVMNIFNNVKDYIMSIMPLITEVFQLYWPIIVAVFQHYLNVAKEIVTFAFNMVWSIIQVAFTNIKNVIELAWIVISGIFKTALQLLTGDFSGAWETMKETASKAIDKLKQTFSDWIDGAKKIGKDFVTGIIDGFLGMWDSLKETASKIWDSITGIFSRKQTVQVEAKETKGANRSHASGLSRVPYDGYQATLHKNERILTPEQTRRYEEGSGGVTIAKLADQIVVREEADIDKIAKALAKEIMQAGGLMA